MDTVAIDPARLGRELCPIANALLEAGYRYAVIGATAILIQGYNIFRATRDVDLVMVVEGGFPAASDLLVEIGLQPTCVSHRFETNQGIQVDILPIASADVEQKSIQIPKGGSLSALGLSEAIRSHEMREVGECLVAVATVPVLIALKLNAAVERTRSDLADSCVCLSGYAEGDVRRHSAHYENSSVLTYETSGAYLAGADFSGNGGPEVVTSTQLAASQLLDNEAALIRSARALGMDERMPLTLLEAFALGMKSRDSRK